MRNMDEGYQPLGKKDFEHYANVASVNFNRLQHLISESFHSMAFCNDEDVYNELSTDISAYRQMQKAALNEMAHYQSAVEYINANE